MKRTEKYQVLNALVSELRYFYHEHKKRDSSHKLDLSNGHTKNAITLFNKLNNQFFKNDDKIIKGNIQYLNTILKELEV